MGTIKTWAIHAAFSDLQIFIDGGKAPVSWRVKIGVRQRMHGHAPRRANVHTSRNACTAGLAAIPVLALLSVIYAAPEVAYAMYMYERECPHTRLSTEPVLADAHRW